MQCEIFAQDDNGGGLPQPLSDAASARDRSSSSTNFTKALDLAVRTSRCECRPCIDGGGGVSLAFHEVFDARALLDRAHRRWLHGKTCGRRAEAVGKSPASASLSIPSGGHIC